MIGLALSDALCASHEGGPMERLLWRFIGTTRKGKIRYTDDTQMSLDVANSLIEIGKIDQDHLARTFANSYKWSRGYGPGTAKILRKVKQGAKWYEANRTRFLQGSFGNGAAMRAPVLALFYYKDIFNLLEATKKTSVITHAHPMAVTGAKLIALSTYYALIKVEPVDIPDRLLQTCSIAEYKEKLSKAQGWLKTCSIHDNNRVAATLGNGIEAINSCVTAIYIALRFMHLTYSDMIDFVKKCSGDTDTIGAMAGAIWGAYNGVDAINHLQLMKLESRKMIEEVTAKLYEMVHK